MWVEETTKAGFEKVPMTGILSEKGPGPLRGRPREPKVGLAGGVSWLPECSSPRSCWENQLPSARPRTVLSRSPPERRTTDQQPASLEGLGGAARDLFDFCLAAFHLIFLPDSGLWDLRHFLFCCTLAHLAPGNDRPFPSSPMHTPSSGRTELRQPIAQMITRWGHHFLL